MGASTSINSSTPFPKTATKGIKAANIDLAGCSMFSGDCDRFPLTCPDGNLDQRWTVDEGEGDPSGIVVPLLVRSRFHSVSSVIYPPIIRIVKRRYLDPSFAYTQGIWKVTYDPTLGVISHLKDKKELQVPFHTTSFDYYLILSQPSTSTSTQSTTCYFFIETKDALLQQSMASLMLQKTPPDAREKALAEVLEVKLVNIITYSSIKDEPSKVQKGYRCHPSNIVMNAKLRDEIFSDVDKFMKNTRRYTDNGLAPKRGYILYGPPGTGKTSFIRTLAAKYSLDILVFRLTETNGLTCAKIKEVMHKHASNRICLFEDVCHMFDISRGGGGAQEAGAV